MTDATRTCSVTTLPTAAAAPVINSKRRGRYPANIVPIWKMRNRRSSQNYLADQAHAATIYPGLIVKVCHRASANFGRLCRVLHEDSGGYWKVEALGGELRLEDGRSSSDARIHVLWIEPQGAPRRTVR